MHKVRRIFIIVLFFALAGLLGYGFYHKQNKNEAQGHKMIGLAVAGGFFILMPTFIYHRWKNKSIKDYMLTKENILKMQRENKGKNP